jgi:mannose/cellobiose epimerase-like protein (N-acyl-D-glucosamine 2-epimerase family)
MIQGRQLYVFSIAKKLGFSPRERVLDRIRVGAGNLVESYSLPSGAFLHSVDQEGNPLQEEPDLYGQAFVMFGLANAYSALRDKDLKNRALELLAYLDRERALSAGGYSELVGGKVYFRSNPHMHLFEAALAWMEVDEDPAWRRLSDELYELCMMRFIDESSGFLGEQFDEHWRPLLESGRFVAEPGHHYEWSWLFQVYGSLTGKEVSAAADLFTMAEKHGVCPRRGVVFDEIWSDGSPKKKTSRYWPQCERIKAAVRLKEAKAADQGMSALLRYLDTPVKGLCFDFMGEDGAFSDQPPKASFLYHVVNAIDEYLRLRPKL